MGCRGGRDGAHRQRARSADWIAAMQQVPGCRAAVVSPENEAMAMSWIMERRGMSPDLAILPAAKATAADARAGARTEARACAVPSDRASPPRRWHVPRSAASSRPGPARHCVPPAPSTKASVGTVTAGSEIKGRAARQAAQGKPKRRNRKPGRQAEAPRETAALRAVLRRRGRAPCRARSRQGRCGRSCIPCAQRVAAHVQGIKSARAARRGRRGGSVTAWYNDLSRSSRSGSAT